MKRTPTPTRADKQFIGLIFVIALVVSFFGAATGRLWLIGPGILLVPITLVLRIPRKPQPDADKP